MPRAEPRTSRRKTMRPQLVESCGLSTVNTVRAY
ncbi:hypothetical protein P3T35_007242 [Kitasatospora sp. GP30]|nr:hypothetical protein [Kitasatospora sp. GP30]